MTIIVYSCNPDITINSSTTKTSPHHPTHPTSTNTSPNKSPTTTTTPQLHHNTSSENLRKFRNSLNSTPIPPQHRKSLIVHSTNTLITTVNNLQAKSDENIYKSIMTKSPVGSQIDITATANKLNHVRTSETGGGGVGNFIKNHLRNTSPSKQENNKKSPKKEPQKSPKSNKKVSNEKVKQNLEPKEVVPRKEERHGSFSSPFKMPKFSSATTSSVDSNLISTATSALRRLHFKSGRNATKTRTTNGTTVPKVIVMGSSSTSETTINTSTDSANTVITTMTNTDDYLTEDSLDKDCSKLIDLDPLKPIHMLKESTDDSLDDTFLEDDGATETTFLFETDAAPKTALFYEQKFTFDSPPRCGSIEPKTPKYDMKEKSETKFNFDNIVSPSTIEKNQTRFNKMVSSSGGTQGATKNLKRRQSENLALGSTNAGATGRISPSRSNYEQASPKSSQSKTGKKIFLLSFLYTDLFTYIA